MPIPIENDIPLSDLIRRRQGYIRSRRAPRTRTSLRSSNPHPRYRANKGGHAPGHLRDALLGGLDHDVVEVETQLEAIEQYLADEDALYFYNPEKQLKWEGASAVDRAKWLIGQLWNCIDILPQTYCAQLDLREGSTYAVAVRKIRDDAMAALVAAK
jgi:hypothetical protein